MLISVMGNRFALREQILEDRLSTAWNAVDPQGGMPVSARIFNRPISSWPAEILFRFRKEMESLKGLEHANLLRVLAWEETEDGRFSLVTEKIDSARPLAARMDEQQGNNDQSMALILQLGSGLLAAHAGGLIHHAVNPSNILVFETGGEKNVKIAGFGTSLLLDLASIEKEEEVAAIFGYMAPEETGILKKPVDVRSDIYSLGIIFYQLVTGRLPYDGRDAATLIYQHIAQKPALPSALAPTVPPVIDRIILRLIAKDPLQRYQTVSGLLADLEEYRRRRATGDEAPDFEIGRSDWAGEPIFATSLVGREKELAQLQGLIARTEDGGGSLAFVHGEAGVGKSRLIDELREYTHGIGGVFIAAKAYQYGSTTPYRVFSEALDAYIEKLKRTNRAGRRAAVHRMRKAIGELGGEAIKISPAIGCLLGPQPELVQLEPEKEKTRFLVTVAALLLSLGEPGRPFVLFLDDLQWADEGSIDLLAWMAGGIDSRPMIVLASYRDTEVSGHHPLHEALGRMREKAMALVDIRVRPFRPEETTRMVAEILHEEPAAIGILTAELHKRTGGNAFFLLELLHSLIDAGIVSFHDNHYHFDREKLETASLPASVGDVIVGRIDDVTVESQRVLAYASIMGREVEFELLSDLAAIPREKVLDALQEGIDNQFLVRDVTSGEKVFFVHDRIQEALYERVPASEKTALHASIARLLEERSKGEAGPVLLYALAHHFARAGDAEKTLRYSLQAGEKARAACAHEQAIRFYGQAKTILEQQGADDADEYVKLLENLGSLYKTTGKFDEALEVLKTCEQLIPETDALRRAEVLSKAGDTLWEKGEGDRAAELLREALKSLGVRLPRTIVGAGLGILKESFIQLFHILLPDLFIRKKYQHDQKREVLVRIVKSIAYFYYFTDMTRCLHLGMKFLNMGERIGPSRLLSSIYATHTVIWSGMPVAFRARRDGNLAVKVAQDLHDRAAEGSAYGYFAVSTYSNRDIQEAYAYALKNIELLKGVGEYWDLGLGLNFRVLGGILLGKNLNEVLENAEETIEIARSANSPQMLGWGLYGKAYILALIGDERLKTEGIRAGRDSLQVLQEVHDNPNSLLTRSFLALAYERAGMYDEAIGVIEEMAQLFPKNNNRAGWIHSLFPIGAQVYLDCIRNNPCLTAGAKQMYLKRARYFCRRALRRRKLFPYIRSHTDQVNGACHWQAGDKEKGIEIWEKGIAFLRQRNRDTYRLAAILLEAGSLRLTENPDDQEAWGYLLEARELFAGLGATFDMQRTSRFLGADPEEKIVESRKVLTLKRQLESLLSVTRTIGSVLNLQKLLDKIIELAMQVTGAERGFLLRYDEENFTLRHEVSRGVDKAVAVSNGAFSLEGCHISLEMIREVEKTRKGVVAGQEDGSFPKIAAELRQYRVREALCVPLIAMDNPIGMIYLDNRLAAGVFGHEELDLMGSFAVQAAISLQNATLLSETMTLNKALQQRLQEIQQAEQDKEKLQAQLFQAQKLEAVGTLAGGIAHDFNNILQAVSGYVELLIGSIAEKRCQEYLQKIQTTVKMASDLVRGLLMLSRKTEYKLRPVNINEEVERAGNLLKRMIPDTIEIRFDLASDLDDINADPIQLDQLMMNLGVNARDAMPGGGKLIFETRNVVLDAQYCRSHMNVTPGRYALLSVSDTGHGMDAQTLASIYDPFFTTKEVEKGTGLGLAVSYSIVQNHLGHIQCYSEVGKGTVFMVYFPVLHAGTEEVPVAPEVGPEEVSVRGQETILLVDDTENLRDLGKDLLEQYGYTVITAESGERALELYAQGHARIGLVILDIGMPGMGGRECLRVLLRINPALKVLVATGFADGYNQRELLEAGAAAFIGKPYRQKDMLQKVRQVLGKGGREG